MFLNDHNTIARTNKIQSIRNKCGGTNVKRILGIKDLDGRKSNAENITNFYYAGGDYCIYDHGTTALKYSTNG